MPEIAQLTLPWLRVNRHRIYAFGGSMGGQETLLLLAKHPRLLAGAAAFDSVTNLARQYRTFPRLPCNKRCRRARTRVPRMGLQALARLEVGGSPKTRPTAYAKRSPFTYARRIAFSCVPLQLWWSIKDRIVPQGWQSDVLFAKIRQLNPSAPIEAFVGNWRHSAEMRAALRLPAALEAFGLLSSPRPEYVSGLHFIPQQVRQRSQGVCRKSVTGRTRAPGAAQDRPAARPSGGPRTRDGPRRR